MIQGEKKRLFWQKEEDKKQLVQLLQQNQIAISSTDTIYGFLGNCTQESYNKICHLKQVLSNRPFIMLIASLENLFSFAAPQNVSDRIVSFLDQCWPGPLTVICKAKPGIASYMVSPEGTIALRCPNHKGLLSVLPHFKGLFSTSANRTMDPTPLREADINPALLHETACFITNHEMIGKPSSIIDLSRLDYSVLQGKKLPFHVIRVGAYSAEELKEIYEKSEKQKRNVSG